MASGAQISSSAFAPFLIEPRFVGRVAGSARLTGSGSEPIELPSRGIVSVPATSLAFTVENLGGLDLIRISPRWPGTAQ